MRNLAFISLFSIFLIFASFCPAGKKENNVLKVVIDPGHGGHDPGTNGQFSKEKDLALKIALKVGKYVESNLKNIEVIYTRKTDEFIALNARADIANKQEADLFISIHANSLPKKTPKTRKAVIQGTEVYVMGVQNTDRALEVAMRENSAILLENNYEKNYNFDPQSQESYIMYNLTQSAYQDNSLLLASLIDDQLTNRAGRKSYGVKQSSLYMMWSTAMPSVLVEIGYLSNPLEEKELNNPQVQAYIASGIYRAIKSYENNLINNETKE